MKIRKATLNDLEQLVEIEKICFPVSEAASRKSFENRLLNFSECFWLLEHNQKIIAFINGMTTNKQRIIDEMFTDSSLYVPNGEWLAIFGVDTLPEYQGNGYASKLMEVIIAEMKEKELKGCVLTCKEKLIGFYEQFGYRNIGKSASVHGGAIWYDMILEF